MPRAGSLLLLREGGLHVPTTAKPADVRRWAETLATQYGLQASDVLTDARGRLLKEGFRWTLPRHAPAPTGSQVEDRRTAPPLAGRRLQLKRGLTLRPYQVKAVEALDRHDHGTLVAPCGSGKTTIGLAVIARRGVPALVCVHTKDLAAQWIDRAAAELPGAKVATWSGKGPAPVADIVVSMIQSLARHATAIADKRHGARFGLILLDEAHHAPARTWAAAISSMPARHRYGLTATPERLDGLTGLLDLHIGPIRHTVPRDELEAAGAILRPLVNLLVTKLQRADLDRIDVIRELTRRRVEAGRSVLVLLDRVEICQDIAADLANTGIPAAELVGALSPTERKRRLADFGRRKLRALVATQLADEALDLPTLDCVILGTPTSATGKVEQRIGRALRPKPGKPQPEVWDLVDADAHAHTLARQALYADLGWQTQIVKLKR